MVQKAKPILCKQGINYSKTNIKTKNMSASTKLAGIIQSLLTNK